MVEKDLQRLTISVDYIDHGQSPRRVLTPRRHHITQKTKIGRNRARLNSIALRYNVHSRNSAISSLAPSLPLVTMSPRTLWQTAELIHCEEVVTGGRLSRIWNSGATNAKEAK